MVLSAHEQQTLLRLVRAAVSAAAHGQALPENQPVPGAERLWREPRGVFVTLNKGRRLRGCIGLIESTWPIVQTAVQMASAAAQEDPRFPAVRPEELEDINIEISLLTPLQRLHSAQEIKLRQDGVLIRRGSRSGVFLPQVAVETGWDLATFLTELCVGKAGLPPRAWEDPECELYRFQVESIKECRVEG
jgi:AmmeMemoRadiSam system protein A